jgi:hypothetical protein
VLFQYWSRFRIPVANLFFVPVNFLRGSTMKFRKPGSVPT